MEKKEQIGLYDFSIYCIYKITCSSLQPNQTSPPRRTAVSLVPMTIKSEVCALWKQIYRNRYINFGKEMKRGVWKSTTGTKYKLKMSPLSKVQYSKTLGNMFDYLIRHLLAKRHTAVFFYRVISWNVNIKTASTWSALQHVATTQTMCKT